MENFEVKKNKIILKLKEFITTREYLGENTLESVIKELVGNLDYFYDSSEETMREYSRIDFSEYTKEEFDDLYLSYINTINITIKVSKDIDTEIGDIIKETFKDERLFLLVKEELKRFNRYHIKRIGIPVTKIELDYTKTNKIQ